MHLYSQIFGVPPPLDHRKLCYINFVDAGTNFNWDYPMLRKSDVYQIFDIFQCWPERQCGARILALQTDNAMELKKLSEDLAIQGIDHCLSVLYSHQQMGFIERSHRHLLDTAIIMI